MSEAELAAPAEELIDQTLAFCRWNQASGLRLRCLELANDGVIGTGEDIVRAAQAFFAYVTTGAPAGPGDSTA